MHSPILLSIQGTVGCIGLVLIVAFVGFLFWRKRRLGKELEGFYPRHGIVAAKSAPAEVLAELGNARWYCYAGKLTGNGREPVPFHWWEAVKTSPDPGGVQAEHFVAVSFAPLTVTQDFISKTKEVAESRSASTSRLKKFFVYDTTNPFRIEVLSDGTFLIVWKVLLRADIYDEKIQFLTRVLNELPIKKEMPMERDTMAEILISAPDESRPQVLTLMQVLDSMSRDYHDTKAHPMMTLDDHAEFYKLDAEQTQFVKNSIQLTTTTQAKLLAAGFDLPEADEVRNEAAIVTFPHRTMTYLIPQRMYIDMNQPGMIYVYRLENS